MSDFVVTDGKWTGDIELTSENETVSIPTGEKYIDKDIELNISIGEGMLYIVDMGTDNSWNYIKYSNGTYEAYRTNQTSSKFTASYSGGYTAASPFTTSTVPSFSTSLTFVEGNAVSYTSTTRSTSTMYSTACMNRSVISANYISIQAWIGTSRTSAVAVDYFCHIRGTWTVS